MGLFGWDDPKQAATYTKKARQSKLARGSMPLLTPEKGEQKSQLIVPPLFEGVPPLKKSLAGSIA